MATHILLTGAGFTRNWGGWLAKELEGDLLGRLTPHPQLQRLVQNSSNFEEALESARSGNTSLSSDQVRTLEATIKASFQAMNAALAERFSMLLDGEERVVDFLARFDAIFTLNQDLLLEIHYNPHRENSRWKGTCYPGLVPSVLPNPTLPPEKDNVLHRARKVERIGTPDMSRQPIYKLHGSIDWSDESGDLFVVGGGKEAYIQDRPLLLAYFNIFREHLSQQNARLMIIGYGWADDHVNRVIREAASTNRSLGIFHVHPEGRDAIRVRSIGPLMPSSISELSRVKCIGESRRLLSSTFGGDALEYGKLMRFFVEQDQ